MSLLSKQDRDLTIESIEYYLQNETEFESNKKNSLQTLLNWIKLENTKYTCGRV